ncbi:putative DHHC palmitoyltransferase family protein [Lyophyllum shimeji]|uniref:Palmitoyltransferase n=1 Tax=Lyophyllum shimeji TaxID=47721 RepID=A0A9P3PMH4_LYOSH|nr:putative DHHC palmitoyltransferase family protein [Lyophyllum shimeji]
MAPRAPLVSFGLEPLPSSRNPNSSPAPKLYDSHDDPPQKPWHHYLPLCGTVLLILAPHPSLLYVLVTYHLQTLQTPFRFATHLLATYTLTFGAFSSLIVCVARDPGPVTETPQSEGDEVGLTEALMPDIDFDNPGGWCRKCWAPKPERTHHCSTCGRCVLKMDHHCPWLGSKCIGHRTYPAFLHFLCSVTLLAIYIAIISASGLWYAFNNPYNMNDYTPIHELILVFTGIIFTFVIGSFFLYHVYLVSTNQTTLENISPFFLLKHLPPLPRTGHTLSDPPLEPELSGPQRRLVKDAHGAMHLYDVGWRNNWAQVFGTQRKFGWLVRLWCGGASPGDGKRFPRNPRAEEMLAKLATELVKIDRNE